MIIPFLFHLYDTLLASVQRKISIILNTNMREQGDLGRGEVQYFNYHYITFWTIENMLCKHIYLQCAL